MSKTELDFFAGYSMPREKDRMLHADTAKQLLFCKENKMSIAQRRFQKVSWKSFPSD